MSVVTYSSELLGFEKILAYKEQAYETAELDTGVAICFTGMCSTSAEEIRVWHYSPSGVHDPFA